MPQKFHFNYVDTTLLRMRESGDELLRELSSRRDANLPVHDFARLLQYLNAFADHLECRPVPGIGAWRPWFWCVPFKQFDRCQLRITQ